MYYKMKNVSCEIEDFIGTHLCKLRGILRSRVPRVLCDLIKNVGPYRGEQIYMYMVCSTLTGHPSAPTPHGSSALWRTDAFRRLNRPVPPFSAAIIIPRWFQIVFPQQLRGGS